MTLQLKRNDTKDTISYNITNLDGSIPNLTGAAVKFVMGKMNTLITYADAVIKDAANGKVEYTLKDTDTLVAGSFNAEFEVTFGDGKVKTYPSDGYIKVTINQNVDKDKSTYYEDAIALRVSDIEVFKTEVNAKVDQAVQAVSGAQAAATSANTAATAANTAATNASTQADRAKTEADRLTGTDVSTLDNKIGALTGLTTKTKTSIVAAINENATSLAEMMTYVTPQMYGAKGDGIADDTQAFNSMLAANKKIFIPNGTYKITSPLTITQGVVMTGEHRFNTCLNFVGLTSGQYAITLAKGYVTLNNFKISSSDTTQGIGTTIAYNGINTDGQLYINLENLYITNFNYGLNLGMNCWNNSFKGLYVYYCNEGIYMKDECNANDFEDCIIKHCTKGFHKIAGSRVTIKGGDISSNTQGIVLEGTGDLSVVGTYFELNANGSINATWGITPFSALFVSNCSFSDDQNTSRIFYFNGDSNSIAVIKDCYFKNVGSGNIPMCVYQSTNFKPVFSNNFYPSTITIDKGKANYYDNRLAPIQVINSNSFTFTSNGIGFYNYASVVPTTPTGYTLIAKQIVRTDANSYNVVMSTQLTSNHLDYYSTTSVDVTCYIKYIYATL